MSRQREKTGEVRFIYKTFICLENIINKFESLLYNLMENKKEAGEAVVRKCSAIKVFLKILQNSQENASARVSLF